MNTHWTARDRSFDHERERLAREAPLPANYLEIEIANAIRNLRSHGSSLLSSASTLEEAKRRLSHEQTKEGLSMSSQTT